jgi:hypothetical protein
MERDGRSIYSPQSGILLQRMQSSNIYNNIDRIVIDKLQSSKKVADALKHDEDIFLLVGGGRYHVTKDPIRTAERNGYRDYELFLITNEIYTA